MKIQWFQGSLGNLAWSEILPLGAFLGFFCKISTPAILDGSLVFVGGTLWAFGWAFLKVYFATNNLNDMVQEIISVNGGKSADTGN